MGRMRQLGRNDQRLDFKDHKMAHSWVISYSYDYCKKIITFDIGWGSALFVLKLPGLTLRLGYGGKRLAKAPRVPLRCA
jgi:hypothetical protein